MMMLPRWRLVAAVLICTLYPASAPAQAPPPVTEWPQRPYRGLFGGNPANSVGVRHSLEANLSFGGGNDVIKADRIDLGFAGLGSSVEGPYSSGGAALSYVWRGRRVSFGASGSSRSRYYPDLNTFLTVGHSGGVGFDATLGRSTRLQAQQTVSYSPLFAANAFPALAPSSLGQIAPVNSDVTLGRRDETTLVSSANLSRAIGPRSSAAVGYVFSTTRFSSEFPDLRIHTLSARFDRRIGRNGRSGVLYTLRDGQYELDRLAAPILTHELDLDSERTWVHSRSRRTTLRAVLGATVIRAEGSQFVKPAGGVDLLSVIGASWSVRAGYRRGVELLAGLGGVVEVDSFGAAVDGLLSERVDTIFEAGWSQGNVGLERSDGRFHAWTGSARLGIALHKSVALFGEIYHYHYDTTVGLVVPGASRARLDRNGVRAGITWWVPLLRERTQS